MLNETLYREAGTACERGRNGGISPTIPPGMRCACGFTLPRLALDQSPLLQSIWRPYHPRIAATYFRTIGPGAYAPPRIPPPLPREITFTPLKRVEASSLRPWCDDRQLQSLKVARSPLSQTMGLNTLFNSGQPAPSGDFLSDGRSGLFLKGSRRRAGTMEAAAAKAAYAVGSAAVAAPRTLVWRRNCFQYLQNIR